MGTGIVDSIDRSPQEAGPLTNEGCPLPATRVSVLRIKKYADQDPDGRFADTYTHRASSDQPAEYIGANRVAHGDKCAAYDDRNPDSDGCAAHSDSNADSDR